MTDSVFQLNCQCNNYPWGRKGQESLSARLCEKTPGNGFEIEDDKNYSEMWLGDYPTLPAKSLSTGDELNVIIDKDPDRLLGKKCIDKFGKELPFLPKILSIQKALPLQIHPNKDLAARLHQEKPDKFTDANHKPEIAIALSKFEVFAGWKRLPDIQALFKLKPMKRFLRNGIDHFDNEDLRYVTQAILTAPDDVIAEAQDAITSLSRDDLAGQGYILDLLPRLQQQYSKQDPGNLVALLCMNYMVLSPGDSLFIPADGIHAYLSGDIVECMARSNDVLNTGFCPRADQDNVEVFSSALTFKPQGVESMLLKSERSEKGKNGKTVVYAPPMSEFNMLLTTLQGGEIETISAIDGPMVLIVTDGSGLMKADEKIFDAKEGYVYFVGHGKPVVYEADSGLTVYAAYAE